MPHLFSALPDKLRLVLSQAANVFLVFVMIYIFQYIFNSTFSCTCTKEFKPIVVIYLGLIPLILFFILILMNQTRTKVCGGCCCGLCPEFFQLLGITLFWVGCVLLDGDLYVCMATKYNDTLREIPCKKDPTLQETSIITTHKNSSQLYGYILIAAGFAGWCLINNTKIVLCCEKCEISFKCLNNIFCEGEPYYKRHYEELLSEETDKHLDEILQNIAKERAEYICKKYKNDLRSILLSKQTDQTSVNVNDCWSAISRSDFYKSSPQKKRWWLFNR